MNELNMKLDRLDRVCWDRRGVEVSRMVLAVILAFMICPLKEMEDLFQSMRSDWKKSPSSREAERQGVEVEKAYD